MEKALELISNRVEKALINKNFTYQKEANNNEVLFVGENIAYGIFFNKDKNIFKLSVCNVENKKVDTDWKRLSEWLFEPGVSSQRDSEMIASDFVSSIAGPKSKKVLSKSKKKKDSERNVDLNFLLNRLVNFFPDVKDEFRTEKENYENFRYINFLENSINPKINTLLNESNKKDRIKKFATLLDNMYSSGNLDVRGAVTVVMLRCIESNNKEVLEAYLSEDLKKAWHAANNLKGKKIKPEKPKKKKRFLADTLK